jgi:hypothetical protein
MRSVRGPGRLVAACLLGISCSSGGGGTGTGGTGASGQAGASAGSSGGTSSAGAGGASSTAGSGGSGGSGGGAAGTSAGGSGGSGASAGTAGTAGATGQAGRGGAVGTAGVSGGAGAGGGTAGRGGAGGDGAGGRGGAAGASPDGGVAGPVTPTKTGNRYRFATGDVVLEIDAAAGARVATLSLGGTHLIVPSGTDPTTWGSVFWTSPRSDWTPQTWPPPVMIDSAPYTGDISGTHVVLSGPTDTSIGVSMRKDYAADASGWIKILYTINATKMIRAAPWEVSRVPRGGIVFFPAGSSVTRGPLTITQSAGIVWFDDAPKTATSPDGDKLYADGSGGWTAYVLNGNLFLKKFVDLPASAQPTGEGEIDIYPGAGFLEFEVQGPYTQIPASGNLPWSIEWKAIKVPAGISVAVGSAALVSFVQAQL